MIIFTAEQLKKISRTVLDKSFCSALKKQHPNMSKKIEPSLKGLGVFILQK